MRRWNALGTLAATAAALAAFAISGAGHGQDVQLARASVSSSGEQGGEASTFAAVSADGRYVAFASEATNLMADTTGSNVFVHDRLTGATELASVSSDGTAANSQSSFPSISGDGRYVAFQSDASTLVAGDTNDVADVFIHDRLTGTTTRVSVSSDGVQGDEESATPSISADGRYVAFTSLAGNLVPNDTNSDRDVFVRDLATGTTELVSMATDGPGGNFNSGGLGAGPARITRDGRYVVFGSFADNLVPNDTNNRDDTFVRDRGLGTTERVTIATDGSEGNGHSMFGSVSDDGRYVAFFSAANNLVPSDTNGASDIFLRDRLNNVTTRISEGPEGVQSDGASQFPALSGDGNDIAFQSSATNLVAGDANGVTDAFVYHVTGGAIERVSAPSGGEANGASAFVTISGDGQTVAFQSSASNLVDADTNGVTDIFVHGKAVEPAPTATPTPRPPTPTPTPTGQGRVGDANGDGRVDSIDAALVLQYSAGLLSAPPGGSRSDANLDGQTNAVDAALILQYSAGLLARLPP